MDWFWNANPNPPPQNRLRRTPRSNISQVLEDEFTCACCTNVLNRPVGLVCGHLFCELCIAKWYLVNLNNTCPTCRNEWRRLPVVNEAVADYIRDLVEQDLVARPQANDFAHLTRPRSEEEERIMHRFTEQLAQNNIIRSRALRLNRRGLTNRPNQLFQFFSDLSIALNRHINFVWEFSVAITLSTCELVEQLIHWFLFFFAHRLLIMLFLFVAVDYVFGISLLLWDLLDVSGRRIDLDHRKFLLNDADLMMVKYFKPLKSWSTAETHEWIVHLGPWASEIARAAHVKQLNGVGLLLLNKAELSMAPFNVRNKEKKSLFILSVNMLSQSAGRLGEIDFWRFIDAEKRNVLLVSLFLQILPRSTLLVLQLRDNHFIRWFCNLLYVFANQLSAVDRNHIEIFKNKLMMVNFNTELVFSNPSCTVYLPDIVTPSISIGKVFLAFFAHTNPLVSLFVALSSWMLAVTEILFFLNIFVKIFTLNFRGLMRLMKRSVKTMTIEAMILLIITYCSKMVDSENTAVHSLFAMLLLTWICYKMICSFRSLLFSIVRILFSMP